MELVIAIIALALVFYSNKKKKQKGQQKPVSKPNVPRQTGNSQTKQQELKRRLEQKYGNVPNKPAQDKKRPQNVKNVSNKYSYWQQWDGQKTQQHTYDVLSRAVANVREEAEGKLSEDPANFCRREMDEDSDLMRQLNDLIIMGYPVKLSYERDFLAEGIQLINQYQSMEL